MAMVDRSYKGYVKWLGPTHPARLEAALGTSRFYQDYNRVAQAEKLLISAYETLMREKRVMNAWDENLKAHYPHIDDFVAKFTAELATIRKMNCSAELTVIPTNDGG